MGISRLNIGGSLPAVISMAWLLIPPLPSFTVNTTLYEPILLSVKLASGVVITFTKPSLEVIFQVYFRRSLSASKVPFEVNLRLKGTAPPI